MNIQGQFLVADLGGEQTGVPLHFFLVLAAAGHEI